ncbi:MAG: hypothetical protein IJX92_02745 [Clostridia bacterium]|nr:hypothetical protein [Clostridia bacterium]
MKNKFSGKKIGAVLSLLASVAVAVLFWLFVKYSESGGAPLFAAMPDLFGTLL